MADVSKISDSTRIYRKIHKWIAVPAFIFMFLIGLSGLLLGWKKQLELLPKTEKSIDKNTENWINIDSISHIAANYADRQRIDNEIDRIDIRPQKGIAKIVFTKNFTELQIDCATGKILAVNTRKSDFIEKIHDGSILDYWGQTNYEQYKLAYTTLVALSLLLLSFSGFWLWYNPIRIRKRKNL